MIRRPVRTFLQTWIGSCAVASLLASCSSPGAGGTGGSGGESGGRTGGAGGRTATGGSAGGVSGASGGAAGSGSGANGGGQAVGTSGGSVTQAGVKLNIPANALSASTVITVSTTTAPSGYILASEAFQFGPSGTTFAQPVVVTIPLTSPASGVHLFWSNASGGFDDVGGTVSGSSLTANVTHFSIGFCAVPPAGGTGGSGATGGASGSRGIGGASGASGSGGQAGSSAAGGISGGAGGGSSGGSTGGTGTGTGGAGIGTGGAGGGTGGSAGTTGTGGTGTGTGGGTGGTGGSAGTTGTGGTVGATDAGLSGDAAASLCKTFGLNLPFASISNVDAGIAPGSSAYTGGTIASGRYYLTSVTHYGGGSYTGSRQAQYTFDATAKTIVIGEFVPNSGSQYVGMTYNEVNANTLQATVVCNSGTTPTGTFDMYYIVNGTQITLTVIGSNDVSLL